MSKMKCFSEFGLFTRHRWNAEGICGRCNKLRNIHANSKMVTVTWPRKSKTWSEMKLLLKRPTLFSVTPAPPTTTRIRYIDNPGTVL